MSVCVSIYKLSPSVLYKSVCAHNSRTLWCTSDTLTPIKNIFQSPLNENSNKFYSAALTYVMSSVDLIHRQQVLLYLVTEWFRWFILDYISRVQSLASNLLHPHVCFSKLKFPFSLFTSAKPASHKRNSTMLCWWLEGKNADFPHFFVYVIGAWIESWGGNGSIKIPSRGHVIANINKQWHQDHCCV